MLRDRCDRRKTPPARTLARTFARTLAPPRAYPACACPTRAQIRSLPSASSPMTDLPAGSIDRRAALHRVALLLGGALSAPAIAGVLAGCQGHDRAAAGFTPRALAPAQAELMAVVAEHIIPATDTPGAREVGAPAFIDLMLAEYYAPADRERFVAGLADLDARAEASGAHTFLRCDTGRQRAILDVVDREAFAGRGPHWFRTMKELTLLGYYTSEIGATKELRYAQVPGRFDGCIPFATVGRSWSV